MLTLTYSEVNMFKKITLLATFAAIVITGALVASPTTNATNTATCIDASKTKNLVYKWTGYEKVEISTKDGKAPCSDTNMYFSAFVMPDTWDKNGFNETAIPQKLHRSVTVKLEAGKANQKVTAKAQMPAACKNVQIDLYFAPEQKVITKTEQIGGRLITAKHKAGTGECVVVTPPKPVAVTPVVETPVEAVTELPAELPQTGASFMTTLIAVLTASGVYAAVLRLRK